MYFIVLLLPAVERGAASDERRCLDADRLVGVLVRRRRWLDDHREDAECIIEAHQPRDDDARLDLEVNAVVPRPPDGVVRDQRTAGLAVLREKKDTDQTGVSGVV